MQYHKFIVAGFWALDMLLSPPFSSYVYILLSWVLHVGTQHAQPEAELSCAIGFPNNAVSLLAK